MTTSVGFIGLGNIGLPLATNLVRSGERVVGYSKAGLEAFASEESCLGSRCMDLPGVGEEEWKLGWRSAIPPVTRCPFRRLPPKSGVNSGGLSTSSATELAEQTG